MHLKKLFNIIVRREAKTRWNKHSQHNLDLLLTELWKLYEAIPWYRPVLAFRVWTYMIDVENFHANECPYCDKDYGKRK